MKSRPLALALVAGFVLATGVFAQEQQGAYEEAAGKVAITTTSTEALDLYIEARTLAEELHQPEAYEVYTRVVEADENFAMAHYGRALTAPSADVFLESVEKAVELSDTVSDGERLLILALQANSIGEPMKAREHLTKLAEMYPGDERVHFAVAQSYNAQQEYDEAIKHYKAAIEINPDYSPAYNSLGYAARFSGRMEEAEKAFKAYIEVLPGQPNPYDSYAEFLMKVGRFEESIEQYEAALEADPSFIFSYMGIGNNQILLDRPAEARETFQTLYVKAPDLGWQRAANTWKAASYIFEGNRDGALEEIYANYELAEKNGDRVDMANDLNVIGTILLEMGGAELAGEEFDKALVQIRESQASDEVVANFMRGFTYNEARVALDAGDIETARLKATELDGMVAGPNDERTSHELWGRIAMAEGDHAKAVEHFLQASQRDARVLYLTGLAYHELGEHEKSVEFADAAANFNELSFNLNYAFARGPAMNLLEIHQQ